MYNFKIFVQNIYHLLFDDSFDKKINILKGISHLGDMPNFFVRQWYQNQYSGMAGRSNLSPFGFGRGYYGSGPFGFNSFSSAQSSSMEFD